MQHQSVPSDEVLTVGKFGKVYGVKGWLRLISYTKPVTNIFDYAPWYIQQKTEQHWQPCEVIAHRSHAGGWIVKLAGCDDRDHASRYVNAHIGVPITCLPPCEPGEFYWHQLIGLRVDNTDGQTLGTVTELFETGANQVMVVNNEQLLPYVDDVILTVDLINGYIQVAWDQDE